jgi:hypothetical protein
MFHQLDFEMMRTRANDPVYHNSDNFTHGIAPDRRFIPYHWGGPYSEGVLLLNLMALASPRVPETVWTKGWDRRKAWTVDKQSTFTNTPLFTYFYAHGFLPLKGFMDSQGVDYWEETKRAIQMQVAYCQSKNYDHGLFGLSACDAPPPLGYQGYHPGIDDGTIAPPSILASIPFAEKESLTALKRLKELDLLSEHYGPVNAYNVFTGWKTGDALSIDVGSMALMLDAYQEGTIQKLMGQNKIVQAALQRAEFLPK